MINHNGNSTYLDGIANGGLSAQCRVVYGAPFRSIFKTSSCMMNYFYFCALFSISKERFLRFLSSFAAYFPGFHDRVVVLRTRCFRQWD